MAASGRCAAQRGACAGAALRLGVDMQQASLGPTAPALHTRGSCCGGHGCECPCRG